MPEHPIPRPEDVPPGLEGAAVIVITRTLVTDADGLPAGVGTAQHDGLLIVPAPCRAERHTHAPASTASAQHTGARCHTKPEDVTTAR